VNIIIAYNLHRHGGGSDAVAERSSELLRGAGHEVRLFVRSSRELCGVRGSLKAFLNGVYAPGTLRDFERMLDAFRPDVVHAHEVYPLITPWIFPICKRRGIRTVMTCHDYRLSCPVATHFRNGRLCHECAARRGGVWPCVRYNCADSRSKSVAYALRNKVAAQFGLFARYVDLFLAPSQKAKEILCRNAGLDSKRVCVVGNPVPDPAGPLAASGPGEYVAYAGRFELEKGFDVLVEAMTGTGLSLKVAGDASAWIRAHAGPIGEVQFLGHLGPAEMSTFYRRARIVVVPSVTHETFGLVVAEALACGTPVIVSDLGALAEVAGPGGVVVPSGDASALRETIVALWNDPARCRSLGQAGREHVKQYSDQRYMEKLLAAYRAAIQ
jgi:glycosyltransferase involved in cell wall biosynthesis